MIQFHAGPVVSIQSPSIVSNAPEASSLPPKATEESKKKPVLPKATVEPRKPGRRLVRPRLGRPEEPQGDREMSEAEGPQIASKPGSSGDTDTQSSPSQLPPSMAPRKRVAPTSTSDLHDESVAHGEGHLDVGALSVKKPKGSDSPQECAEGQTAATSEHTSSQPTTEESFDAGEDQNDDTIEAQNEEDEVIVEKVESKDPLNVDSMIQEEPQGDSSSMLEENLDQTVEAKLSSDDMQRDQGEPDNQQSAMEVEGEKEDGELLAAEGAADGEGGNDVFNLVDNQEIREGHSEPAATPDRSPMAAEDEEPEAGEINSPELSTDDKNEEGELAEEAADGSDKSNDANEQIAAETDREPSPAPAPSTTEPTLTSSAPETGSSRIIPVPRKSPTKGAPESGEVKQSSPASSTSTTINLLERARERAQMRQAGVVGVAPPIGRGRGRGTPRGRAARGGRAVGGRRQPPTDG